jgi:hypothetical protein
MADEITPNVGFNLQPHGAQLWDEPLRQNFRITDQYLAQFLALRVTLVSGLQVQVAAGTVRIGNVIYPFLLPTALTMLPNTINYIYVNAAGRLANVSGYPVNSVPLARVLTGPSSILNIVDDRTFFSAGGVSAGVSSIGVVGLTDIVDGNVALVEGDHINISVDPVLNRLTFDVVNALGLDRKYRVNLSAQIDGITSVFTFPDSFEADKEEVFLDGILRDSNPGNDYVIIDVNKIMFNYVPTTVQKLWVNYNPV